MSVKVMTAVFERYPTGGGEMLLALALADHASDDGSKVYPSIRALAEKTRQSERTVQYQLRRMEASGWLILVSAGHGGRSMTSEYRISPAWLNGAEIAPFSPASQPAEKGAEIAPFSAPSDVPASGQKGADFAPFEPTERVQSTTQKGAIHDTKGCNPQQERVQPVAPANNRHRTIKEPSKNQSAQARACPHGVDEKVWADWLELRKAHRAPVTDTALAGIEREAHAAGLSLADALTVCCANGWRGFKAEWIVGKAAGHQVGRAAPRAASYAERDEQARRARWEQMTGQPWPGNNPATDSTVIDVTPAVVLAIGGVQ